ncbi:MAG TPA: acetyl-CoA hydrolase/transferase C-terminal domain-containing protein [Anaerovoracaceae bacterium]|nr:acetyl-CoA hydrolase/transferase C-terminal domain-containing protein [Anaerovoracaceae bacterium]
MNFSEVYKSKITTSDKIAGQIKSGWNCCTDIALAYPGGIIEAVKAKAAADDKFFINIYTMLDVYPMNLCSESSEGRLSWISWFSGGNARKAVNEGRADIMPCYYRDIPGLYIDYVDIDAYCAVVSPMDKHGYFSTGCSGSSSFSMIRKARFIYLEVNEHMPRTLNAPQIHISQVTAFHENNYELSVLEPTKPDDISITIGNLIADEVPNGATIQLGIGAIPDAVGMALKSKHDLGIHSEMFTDSMVELLECGAANNNSKPIHRGRTVITFALGSKRMYNYIDDNPGIEVLPVDYVNNPATIAQHPDFRSINAALEVDFFGQVCAESIGTRHLSGTGGQVDFVRGAVQSKGGKSFIAFPSTAKNGTISRITPTLSPGAIVTTSKNDVDYIVTEYGIAKLRGRTLSQRTKALILIAHPDFRDQLTFMARKSNIIV